MPTKSKSNPFTSFEQVRLAHLMVLAKVGRAAAIARQRGDHRSANVIVAEDLGVRLTKVTEALVALEKVFGDDLQEWGAARRTGRLTAKGRCLAAAAGTLGWLLELIEAEGTDHEAVLAYLNRNLQNVEGRVPIMRRKIADLTPELY